MPNKAEACAEILGFHAAIHYPLELGSDSRLQLLTTGAFQSLRKVRIGSIFVARRAGIQQASSAIAMTSAPMTK